MARKSQNASNQNSLFMAHCSKCSIIRCIYRAQDNEAMTASSQGVIRRLLPLTTTHMTAPTLPLADLAQQLSQKQFAVEALRLEYEQRLQGLRQRKDELETE